MQKKGGKNEVENNALSPDEEEKEREHGALDIKLPTLDFGAGALRDEHGNPIPGTAGVGGGPCRLVVNLLLSIWSFLQVRHLKRRYQIQFMKYHKLTGRKVLLIMMIKAGCFLVKIMGSKELVVL